jgi:hypothetical protein
VSLARLPGLGVAVLTMVGCTLPTRQLAPQSDSICAQACTLRGIVADAADLFLCCVSGVSTPANVRGTRLSSDMQTCLCAFVLLAAPPFVLCRRSLGTSASSSWACGLFWLPRTACACPRACRSRTGNSWSSHLGMAPLSHRDCIFVIHSSCLLQQLHPSRFLIELCMSMLDRFSSDVAN